VYRPGLLLLLLLLWQQAAAGVQHPRLLLLLLLGVLQRQTIKAAPDCSGKCSHVDTVSLLLLLLLWGGLPGWRWRRLRHYAGCDCCCGRLCCRQSALSCCCRPSEAAPSD
jgi:hypothetical protein